MKLRKQGGMSSMDVPTVYRLPLSYNPSRLNTLAEGRHGGFSVSTFSHLQQRAFALYRAQTPRVFTTSCESSV